MIEFRREKASESQSVAISFYYYELLGVGTEDQRAQWLSVISRF